MASEIRKTALVILFSGLPLLLAVMLIAGAWEDETSGWLRVIVFSLFCCVGAFRLRWGFLLVFLSCSWFELLAVAGMNQNQFLIESGVLGLLVAIVGRDFRYGQSVSWKRQLSPVPLSPVLLYIVVFSSVSLLVSMGELHTIAAESFSRSRVFLSIVRQGFHWDVRSPVHPVSIVFGYMIALLFFAQLWRYAQHLKFSYRNVSLWLIAGLAVNFSFAYAQHMIPGLPAVAHLSEPTGFFQNGNHLSFMAFFSIFLTLSLLPETHSQRLRWLLYVSIPYAMGAAFIGGGKGAFVGVLVSAVFAGALWFSKSMERSIWQKMYWPALGTLATGGFLLLVYLLLLDVSLQLPNRSFRLRDLVGEERFSTFLLAFKTIDGHWLTGVGLGNFFLRGHVGYDIHNLFITMIAETGLVSLLVLVVSSGLFAWSCWHAFFRRRVDLAGVVLVVMCLFAVAHLVDYYFSYRSILLLTFIWLTAVCLRLYREDAFFNTISKWQIRIVAALALILGACTIFSPQTRPVLRQSYPTEFQMTSHYKIDFYWSGPIATLNSLPPGECKLVGLKPVYYKGSSRLVAGSTRDDVPYHLRLPDITSWETDHLYSRSDFALKNGRWNMVCFCMPEKTERCPAEKPCNIYLRSDNAQYIGWYRHFSYDKRFISFGISERLQFSREEMFRRPLNSPWCSQIINL